MDTLDQVVAAAAPLLSRVDAVLTEAGAPADHPVWAQLRRVRLLPGDAVRSVAALNATELAGAAPELRADARAYADIASSLPAPDGWSGDAADAYDAARHRTANHISGNPYSLDERLEASADLAEALTDWISRCRDDVAVTLGEILGSTDALSLAGAEQATPSAAPQVRAAANVAERLLRTVADDYDLALELLDDSAELAHPADGDF